MYNHYQHAGHAHSCGHAHHRRGFGGFGHHRRPKHNVPVNIIETLTQYEVHVYALGFDKENIKISVADDILYVSGTRTVPDDYQPNFTTQEYPIKSFERALFLNGQVTVDGITAAHENGVLKITLPKTPDAEKSEHVITVN